MNMWLMQQGHLPPAQPQLRGGYLDHVSSGQVTQASSPQILPQSQGLTHHDVLTRGQTGGRRLPHYANQDRLAAPAQALHGIHHYAQMGFMQSHLANGIPATQFPHPAHPGLPQSLQGPMIQAQPQATEHGLPTQSNAQEMSLDLSPDIVADGHVKYVDHQRNVAAQMYPPSSVPATTNAASQLSPSQRLTRSQRRSLGSASLEEARRAMPHFAARFERMSQAPPPGHVLVDFSDDSAPNELPQVSTDQASNESPPATRRGRGRKRQQ